MSQSPREKAVEMPPAPAPVLQREGLEGWGCRNEGMIGWMGAGRWMEGVERPHGGI